MHGIINLLKPPGMTSHDAVAFVRRALNTKRVGHTGTLDPAASGVLPICVGQATRLAEYFGAGRKSYVAEATFGYETDTLDAVGKNLRERDASGVTEEAISAALEAFRGDIEQVPPAYSAIKVEGKKLYDLARAGQVEESELTPRAVTIHSLRLAQFMPDASRPRALIHVECSTGTYIRSLVRDLGRALGCGATMSFLVRTRSGDFSIENALTLEEVSEYPPGALLPMDESLRLCGFPVVVDSAAARDCVLGRRVQGAVFPTTIPGRLLAVRDEAGTIIALVEPGDESWFQPVKVLILDS